MVELRMRVLARGKGEETGGLTSGLAPIHAGLDEMGKIGFERASEGMVSAGKLMTAAWRKEDNVEVKVWNAKGEGTKIEVSEDEMHVGDYVVEMTTLGMKGGLWPREVVKGRESKRFYSSETTLAWLVERLAPYVLEMAAEKEIAT